MSFGMTEYQKMRAQLAAQILAGQIPAGMAIACRDEVTANTHQAIVGAVKIAEAILQEAQQPQR